MKYLLTGSEGFIGKKLGEKLKLKGDVYGVDLKNGLDLKSMEVVNNLPECDMLFHFAATNGTKIFYDHPQDVLVNNSISTINLVQKYSQSNIKFIFASTCEIFNGATDLGIYKIPTDENVPVVFDDILNPRWSYSLPKALGENLIANSMKNWLIIRYFNIYGPGQVHHFINEFVERVKLGQYFIKGDDTRSFCYIDDAVNISEKLSHLSNNMIVNIGAAEEVKISSVAKMILKFMGVSPNKLEIRPGLEGSAKRRCPDVKKALSITNYKYQYSLENGLKKTVESLL